ncbi:unnamed protein product [Ceratitis capitata]|uniref:(Mediterranean fruit fly) hypothetical protein n=1 Tax=Ceratitis capitata TaxID=7213 RepID=A0A811UVF9_CERCA|nr:unnamed protein product [Ceratitis capitata]
MEKVLVDNSGFNVSYTSWIKRWEYYEVTLNQTNLKHKRTTIPVDDDFPENLSVLWSFECHSLAANIVHVYQTVFNYFGGQQFGIPQLEINPKHGIIKKLNKLPTSDPELADLVTWSVLDLLRIRERY